MMKHDKRSRKHIMHKDRNKSRLSKDIKGCSSYSNKVLLITDINRIKNDVRKNSDTKP